MKKRLKVVPEESSLKETKPQINPAILNVRQPELPIEERIRHRAYELYEQRGCQDGYHEQDWLQAEAEIRTDQRLAA